MVALIGASGSGKSTLLGHVAGFLPGDSGAVTVLGRQVQSGGGIVDGPENAVRARAWQKAHPNYWKGRKKRAVVLQNVCRLKVVAVEQDNSEVLQNVWRTQPPLLLGLISKITGSVLQHDIAQITGQLIASGRALVGPNH